MLVFNCRPFPKILKYNDHQWNLPTIWKTRSLRQLRENSASIQESSGSQFFRTATGIQSEADTFEKASSVMTFITILGVTEILYSFKLVLEGKTGKWIPESSRLEFLQKFLPNNFALSETEHNTFGLLGREGITK